MEQRETDLTAELERLGEAEVRSRLAKGEFGMIGSSRSRFVNRWLAAREDERRSAAGKRALSQLEEARSMAAEALSHGRAVSGLARQASFVAIAAMICSLIALLVALFK